MAKIKRNKQQTIVTFVIDGNEDNRAVTMSFIPGLREIILSGRRARRALKAFKD